MDYYHCGGDDTSFLQMLKRHNSENVSFCHQFSNSVRRIYVKSIFQFTSQWNDKIVRGVGVVIIYNFTSKYIFMFFSHSLFLFLFKNIQWNLICHIFVYLFPNDSMLLIIFFLWANASQKTQHQNRLWNVKCKKGGPHSHSNHLSFVKITNHAYLTSFIISFITDFRIIYHFTHFVKTFKNTSFFHHFQFNFHTFVTVEIHFMSKFFGWWNIE